MIAKLVADSGVEPEDIEDLILGCAFPEGEQGLNLAPHAGLHGRTCRCRSRGTTVNRFCGSSMTAIHMAAGAIAADAGDVFICAGVEMHEPRADHGLQPLPNPALSRTIRGAYIGHGRYRRESRRRNGRSAATNRKSSAVTSHSAPRRRPKAGKFADEIVPIQTGRAGSTQDGMHPPGHQLEGLAGLKPAFDANMARSPPAPPRR